MLALKKKGDEVASQLIIVEVALVSAASKYTLDTPEIPSITYL